MIELDQKQRADFYHRSYTAADGLWFLKVEEAYGFEAALDIDDAVWQVLPKIQARMLKALVESSDRMRALFECFTTKQELEGFTFKAEFDEGDAGFDVIIQKCPWHEAMIKADREHLSGKVGSRICRTECSVWASEFGSDIEGTLRSQICNGSECCKFQFRRLPP